MRTSNASFRTAVYSLTLASCISKHRPENELRFCIVHAQMSSFSLHRGATNDAAADTDDDDDDDADVLECRLLVLRRTMPHKASPSACM